MKRIYFILLIIILLICSCKQKTKTIILQDISINVPENFKDGFLDQTVAIDESVAFNESYGLETKTAIYTIVYTKYKNTYNGLITLQNAKNNIINGLRNHYAIKEFQVEMEGIPEGSTNSYRTLTSFYYGPNKTYHQSYLLLHNNGLLQVICMYNANSKKDDREFNNIIKSINIITNN